MSTPELSAPNRKRRAAWLIGGAVVVVIVVLLVMSLTTGSARSGDEALQDPTSTVSPTVPPAAPTSAAAASAVPAASLPPQAAPPAPVLPVPLPPAEAAAAEANTKDFMAAKAEALATPAQAPALPDFQAVATGSALDAMVANSQEFATNGWHQEGTPTVMYVTVTGYEPAATPPRATLNVCVDSSAVNVVTAAGEVIKQGTAADRSLNILTVVLSNGKWLVSDENLPADPSC